MSDEANKRPSDEVDVLLIGAGIMSATLSAMLQQLEPNWSQAIYERLDAPAQESSYAFNNAGTGHSALCELNYTPEVKGKIEPTKAININEKFQKSRQFWSYLVEDGQLENPNEFINPVPHMSFAQGDKQVDYLRRRFDLLSNNHMFPNMKFSDDPSEFAEQVPLMAAGRDFDAEKVAISWTNAGTDIDYGSLTRKFLSNAKDNGVLIRYGHQVTNLKRNGKLWDVTIRNTHTKDTQVVRARFVFVGAGGYALDLLRKAGIPEVRGFAGFPISGLWLRTTNPELVKQHRAKVYGQAKVGAPPMSVPHLDLRVVNGEESLLFGPYGGWSPKFLKKGSYLDLFKSIRLDNIPSYLGVAATNLDLVQYLVSEVFKNFEGRLDVLREYYPDADGTDWDVVVAGQRVQVIKPASAPRFGTLEFGTALVNDQEGSIAGILGASPGASITPSAMLELLERCFGKRMINWGDKLHEMFPTYGIELRNDPEAYQTQWDRTQKTLNLEV